jgi:hypothetical protein
MKLDKQAYGEKRAQMRQELARLRRMDAMRWEIILLMRRISRLDMAWLREEEWYDIPAREVVR